MGTSSGACERSVKACGVNVGPGAMRRGLNTEEDECISSAPCFSPPIMLMEAPLKDGTTLHFAPLTDAIPFCSSSLERCSVRQSCAVV